MLTADELGAYWRARFKHWREATGSSDENCKRWADQDLREYQALANEMVRLKKEAEERGRGPEWIRAQLKRSLKGER